MCVCQDEKQEEIKGEPYGESKIVRNSKVIVHNIGNKVYSDRGIFYPEVSRVLDCQNVFKFKQQI